MFKEGLGDAIGNAVSDAPKNALSAIAQDITKNTGAESFVQGFINDIFEKAHIDQKVMERVKDWKLHKDAANSFSKSIKGKDLGFIRDDLKNRRDDDNLFKFYRWIFFIRKYITKEKDDIIIQDMINFISDLSSDKPNISKDPNLQKIQREIIFIFENKVQDVVNRDVKAFKDEYNKAASSKTRPLPETKGNIMSFKQFYTEQEKKLKEDNISSLQAKTAQEKKKVADAQKRTADSESKLTQAQLKAQALQAKQAADAAKVSVKTGLVAEGTYAGGDGVKKKIPFTQNSNLQNQAVGPKDPDAKDKEEEDDELTAAKERIKKLEKLTKELQKAADESNKVAIDNIDATADTLIDKMAAKERNELKEAASDWEKMEAQLKQLDEGCVGGVCTMGGRSGTSNSGPIGDWGIAPMGQIGGLSMPLPIEQNPVPQVADRSTIYNFIKNNDLHRTNRDFALNALTDKFGNASTELSAILSDAILSDGDPEGIDQSYGYSPDSLLAVQAPPEDEPVSDHIAQATQMSNAWGQMEEKLKDL